MHVLFVLTRRVLFPLVIFIVVLAALDVSAKPLAPKKTGVSSNDDEENLLHPQRNINRAETSTKDESTYVFRCGTARTEASYSHNHRKRRYTVTPFKITNKLVITWSVKVYSNKLTHNEQLNVFKAAFKQWDDVATVNFSYVSSPSQAHIVISFTTSNFDGPSGELAHAYYYTSANVNPGHIHFDEDENWVTSNTGSAFEVNLLAVALHEIGHTVGIAHSSKTQSVMYPTTSNSKTQLYEDDIKAIRWLYGKCEVRDITAVMHDRYFDGSDTVLVLNKDKVYRLDVHDGFLYQEINEKWPKDIRDYFRVTGTMYDKVFPLRAALFVYGYRDMHLMGQKHFVRKIPFFNTGTTGRYYDFKDEMIYDLKNIWGPLIPEGPLPYSPMNTEHTPDFFKDFQTTNVKFGAAYQYTSSEHWQHFFMNGTHYKVSPHSVTNYHIEDVNVNFPGAPREPDAAWYDNKNFQWYFFKGDRYYKLDTSTQQYTDRGPISLLWHSPCD